MRRPLVVIVLIVVLVLAGAGWFLWPRFEREARIVQPLDHDNIARLKSHFSAFRTEFIVMEFCEGSTLAELLARRGPEA